MENWQYWLLVVLIAILISVGFAVVEKLKDVVFEIRRLQGTVHTIASNHFG